MSDQKSNNPFAIPGLGGSMMDGPFANSFNDGLDFIKQFWGGMNTLPGAIPGLTTPTMDINELDKRIKDLRAVENWLNLNLKMLQGTVQGLEVQRATLAALQSFGQVLKNGAGPTPPPEDKPRASSGFSGWPERSVESASPPEEEIPDVTTDNDLKDSPEETQASTAEENYSAAASSTSTKKLEQSSASPVSDQAMAAAGAWWNMLNQQFQKIASATLPGQAASSINQPAETKNDTPPKPAVMRGPGGKFVSTKSMTKKRPSQTKAPMATKTVAKKESLEKPRKSGAKPKAGPKK